MSTTNRTDAQNAVIAALAENFEIDPTKILFLNREQPLEPWLPADVLMGIARQSGLFKAINEEFATYIEPLKQVVHVATVIDPEDRIFTRTGAATLGERLGDSVEPAEPHSLASARALKAVLDAAGFNPAKAAPVLKLRLPPEEHAIADQATSRTNDLATIHTIARDKGLIRDPKDGTNNLDMTAYRAFLAESFGVNTAAALSPEERSALINRLRELPEQACTDLAA